MTMTISLKSQIDMLQKEAETHAQDQQVFMATAKRNRELAEQLQLAEANAKWYLARAEAAEADNRRLAVRVAELEAALAAQGWRPVTEDWPPYNERVIIGHGGGYGGGWCVFARRVRTDDRDGDDWLMDDDMTLAFESAVVAMQRPLPPAPQETE